jgi:hypothetical protein
LTAYVWWVYLRRVVRKKRLFAVAVSGLLVRFDRRVDANRFRRALRAIEMQGWMVPEVAALRLRDLVLASSGRSCWTILEMALESDLLVPWVLASRRVV